MSSENHKIQRVLFEISSTDSENYKSDEIWFSDFFNNSLLIALEQVFEEINIDHKTISISKIELDIGLIKRNALNENLTILIKDQLKSILLNEVALAKQLINLEVSNLEKNNQNKETQAIIKDSSRSELDVLMYFLINGYLPWWANSFEAYGNINDIEFINELKNVLLKEANRNWIIRLINQYNVNEIILLLNELVNTSDKYKISNLFPLVHKLYNSLNENNNKTSKGILRKIFEEIISNNGKVRSSNDLINEYKLEDPYFKKYIDNYSVNFNEINSEERLSEFINSEVYLNSEVQLLNQVDEIQYPLKSLDNDLLVVYYLYHGSLPPLNYAINRKDFESLVSTFIINNKSKLNLLFKENKIREFALIDILNNLSTYNFNKIINSTDYQLSEDYRLIINLLNNSNLKSNVRFFASSLVAKNILGIPVSIDKQLFRDKLRGLNDITFNDETLKKELENIKSLIADTNEGSRINIDLDSDYFLDLLFFIIEFNDWPWWGKAYIDAFGNIDLNNSLKLILSEIIKIINDRYPKVFIDFCEKLSISSKPSILLNKFDWPTSKIILNNIFPYYVNGFVDTIESVLNFLFKTFESEKNSLIVTQQFLYFLLDNNKFSQLKFNEFVGEILSNISEYLDLPLASIYNTLKSNYLKLELKNSLSLINADYLFSYDNVFEKKHFNNKKNRSNQKISILSSKNFIDSLSIDYKASIINYINGDESALAVFPSNWTLGVYLLENVKNSTGFSNILFQYFLNGDLKCIYNIIQLEKLSQQKWISLIINEKEQFELYNELSKLLNRLSIVNSYILEDFVRAIFLRNYFVFNSSISVQSLGLFISSFSKYTGYSPSEIEFEITKSLSIVGSSNVFFNEYSKPNVLASNSPLIDNNLNTEAIETYRSYIITLIKKLEEIDFVYTSSISVLLENINNKFDLIEWIKNLPDFIHKINLTNYFERLVDPILFNYSKVLLIVELKKHNLFRNNFNENNVQSSRSSFEVDFIDFQNMLSNISKKISTHEHKFIVRLIYIFKNLKSRDEAIYWLKHDPNFYNERELINYFENIDSYEVFCFSRDLIINELEICEYYKRDFNEFGINYVKLVSFDFEESVKEVQLILKKLDNSSLLFFLNSLTELSSNKDLVVSLSNFPDFSNKSSLINFIQSTQDFNFFSAFKKNLLTLLCIELDTDRFDSVLKEVNLEFSEFFLKLSDEYAFNNEFVSLFNFINSVESIDLIELNKVLDKVTEVDLVNRIKNFINSYLKKLNLTFSIVETVKDVSSFKFSWWKLKLNFNIHNSNVKSGFKELIYDNSMSFLSAKIILPTLDSFVKKMYESADELTTTFYNINSIDNDSSFIIVNKEVLDSNNLLLQLNNLNSQISYLEKSLKYFEIKFGAIEKLLLSNEQSNLIFGNIDSIVIQNLILDLEIWKRKLLDIKYKIDIDNASISDFKYDEIISIVKYVNDIEVKFNYISGLFIQYNFEKSKIDKNESGDSNSIAEYKSIISEFDLLFNDLYYELLNLNDKVHSNFIVDEFEISNSLQILSVKLDDFYRKVFYSYSRFTNYISSIDVMDNSINDGFRSLIFQIDAAKKRLDKFREIFILNIRRVYTAYKQDDFDTEMPMDILMDSDVKASSISDENICDIAIFFFLYKELPWWSSIRELSVLQNLVRNLVVKSPIVFKNRILQALEAYPEIVKEIMVDLKLNTLIYEPVKLDKDIDELLKNDLEFVLLVLNSNTTLSYLKSIVFEIIINIKKFKFNEKDIIDVFRKSVIQTFKIEEHLDFFKSLEATPESKSSLHAEYEFIYSKVVLDDKINYRSSKNFFNLLLDLEKKYNDEGLKNGISITKNIYSIYDLKQNFTNSEVFNSWLYMLESYTGVSTQFVKNEIINDIEYIAFENRSPLSLKLVEIASAPTNESVFIAMPFSNLIIAISKILSSVNTISSIKREFALKFVSQLFLLDEFKGNVTIPISLFIKYLSDNSVSSIQVLSSIQLLISREKSSEIKSDLSLIGELVNGKVLDSSYFINLHEVDDIDSNEIGRFTDNIDILIKHFQDGDSIFEKIAESKSPLRPFIKVGKLSSEKLPKKLNYLNPEARIYIPNAGLLILWPFLTRLFSNLKYTNEGLFINEEKRLRAVFLTQYLVAFTEDNPEYTLMLNKLLCGMDINDPIIDNVILTDEEKSEAENLISSVLIHWKEMNNTSPKIFQQTFIQREGIIFQKEGNWNVIVNHSTFDILLLKLPWGLSIIKYPWNNYLIYVEWKAMS
jgi:hypothetical protein